MRFQPVKCNMMQLTNKQSSKIQANYTLEGTVLENVESVKYRGVSITNDLKWNTHIYNVHPIDSLYTVESVKDTVPVIERIFWAKDAR